MSDSRNLTILISGAAGRIGSAVAKNIIDQGGTAILLDNDEGKLFELKESLGTNNTHALTCDITNRSELEKKIDVAFDHIGNIDGAVHSAYPRSAGWGTSFENLSEKYLASDLMAQLGGAIFFSQFILQRFVEQKRGSLVHISSIQGIAAPKFDHYEGTSMVSPIEYSAIKSGVIAVTRYLAKYYRGQGVRVNCVSPGGLLDLQPESFVNRYRQDCNNKGLLASEDIAGAICFLLGDESKFITGQNIVVDDGWSL
jgi:NAD(P)-dependent dehydrogenase (short-subunit alcohol dehydrogenase family)